jgi:acyl carrier protein
MKNKEQIINELTSIFKKVFDEQHLILSEDLTAKDVNNWDSLTHTIMIGEVEDHFQIRFKMKDLVKMRKVGDLIQVITEKLIENQ